MAGSFPIRPEVLELTPYTPGLSIDEIQQRFGLGRVVKLASNENPLGTSPQVQKVLRDKAGLAFRYTQSGNPRLVNALAASLGVEPECVVLGNGSDEIIDLLIRVCPTPGVHSVVACQPSFSLYGLQSRFAGVAFRTVPLKNDFSFDWQGLRAAVDESTALVFITTPDNPSGYCPPVEEVRAFAASLPPTCLLVVDEAYIDFCDDMSAHSLLGERASWPQLVLLRTFSKCYGLAGLRLGYGIMPPRLAQLLCTVRLPFSVNILAEEAGLAALGDATFRQETIATVSHGRVYLRGALEGLGCQVLPSQSNFLMFQLPPSCPLSAKDVFEKLLSQGMIIRPLTSYGLPGHLRVSVGTREENQLFIQLLTEVLA